MAEDTQETPDLSAQVEYLRGLAKVVTEEGLSEIEIEADGFKLALKTATPLTVAVPQGAPVQGYAAPPLLAAPGGAPAPKAKAAGSAEALTPIVSPMVGVFYSAPSPADPNFIAVGDRVERGQVIGLVEAMKSFNEIVAESAGVVASIPAETGQLVETGQTLVLLK
ncbi:acetyl-CoA carboxylase biotin carboxyl carrier protein [bacterium]|nr:MAG: acetyl-CoA carboxylase biotin carboxyl carrier protein [bacterium]